jgi:hypothetical protein
VWAFEWSFILMSPLMSAKLAWRSESPSTAL